MIKIQHTNMSEPYGGKKAFAEKYGLPLEKVEKMSLSEMDEYAFEHIEDEQLDDFLNDVNGIFILPDGF